MSIAKLYRIHSNPDPQSLAQECIAIFDDEFKRGYARITNTGAIRIDSPKFGQFYTKSEQLRELDYKEYTVMRRFLIKQFT